MQVQQYIQIPTSLYGFHNTATTVERAKSGRDVYLLQGDLQRPEEPPHCPRCGCRMHKHGSREVTLRHLSFGSHLTAVRFERHRYRCPKCSHTEMEDVLFKADGHSIT